MNASSSTQPAIAMPKTSFLGRIGTQNISLLIALIILLVIFTALRPDVFFTPRNLINIGLAVTILGILAMAQTVVIVAGGLDISVGSMVGLTTVSAAMAIQATDSAGLGIVAGLVIGGIAGIVNGLIITYGRVNAVIATLGTMAIFRGIAFILSDGQSISIFNETYRFMGVGTILGLQFPIWVLIASAILFQIFLAKTIVGRNVYALGGNPVVARFSGIKVNRYRIGIYVMSGFFAGVAGILLAARLASGSPTVANQLLLPAISAVLVGGTAITGGIGGIGRTLVGALTVSVVRIGMTFLGVNIFAQQMVFGAVLILAVAITLDRGKILIAK